MAPFIFGILLILVGVVMFIVKGVTTPAIGNPRLGQVTPAKHRSLRGLALIPLVLGIVLIVGSMVRVVGATSVGIPVTFGKIGSPLSPGVQVVAPWTTITEFSTRLQESNMTNVPTEGDRTTPDGVEVLSNEGGRLILDVTVRYSLVLDSADQLYRQVGSMDGIRERVIRPDARSLIRDVYSRYKAEEAYTSKREVIATIAETELRDRLAKRGIVLDALKVRDAKLEEKLQTQITAKLEAKQQAEKALILQGQAQTEAETRKKVAQTDAEAKVISAQGEADANNILSKSLTDVLLKAKEIEALSKSGSTIFYPFGQPITPLVTTPAAGQTTTTTQPKG